MRTISYTFIMVFSGVFLYIEKHIWLFFSILNSLLHSLCCSWRPHSRKILVVNMIKSFILFIRSFIALHLNSTLTGWSYLNALNNDSLWYWSTHSIFSQCWCLSWCPYSMKFLIDKSILYTHPDRRTSDPEFLSTHFVKTPGSFMCTGNSIQHTHKPLSN